MVTGLEPGYMYVFKPIILAPGKEWSDALWTDNRFFVVSLPAVNSSGALDIKAGAGLVTRIGTVDQATMPDANRPAVTFPYGMLSYDIQDIPVGSTVNIILTYSSAMPSNTQYWKYDSVNGWQDITSLLSHNDGDNILELNITDGGLGDADGIANGIITDPGGPGIPMTAPTVTTGNATAIGETTATLNGNLSSKGTASSVILSFEYGLTTSYGNTAAGVPPTTSTAPQAFSASISNLASNTLYHYRVAAAGDGTANGDDMTFTTTAPPPNPLIGTGVQTSHGSSMAGATTTAQTVSISNIQTQSASLSPKTVTPGSPVTVTADITNKGAVNGNKAVTLYVNGQAETTQGITVNSGGSSQLIFNITRGEPGTYAVYVDGVPAGSFKVELFRESDIVLIFSITMLAMAFILGMVMLWRRQRSI